MSLISHVDMILSPSCFSFPFKVQMLETAVGSFLSDPERSSQSERAGRHVTVKQVKTLFLQVNLTFIPSNFD